MNTKHSFFCTLPIVVFPPWCLSSKGYRAFLLSCFRIPLSSYSSIDQPILELAPTLCAKDWLLVCCMHGLRLILPLFLYSYIVRSFFPERCLHGHSVEQMWRTPQLRVGLIGSDGLSPVAGLERAFVSSRLSPWAGHSVSFYLWLIWWIHLCRWSF